MPTAKSLQVLGLIPARGGSKGIPKKNIVPFAGKPLMAWVCEAAQKATLIDELVVSSDSDEILATAAAYGIPTRFKRPPALGQDETLVVEVIHHALTWFQEQQAKNFDYVCLIQPTAPFAQPQDYDCGIRKAIKTDADTVISVYPCEQQHPAIMFILGDEDRADWFLKNEENRMFRRQDLPLVYLRSGLVYVFKATLILEEKKLYGEKIYAIHVPPERGAMDINTTMELKIAEVLMQEYLKNE